MRMRWVSNECRSRPFRIAALLRQSRELYSPLSAAPLPQRPNIVVFMLDDLDALTMPYWDAMPKTRARLRDRGRTVSATTSRPRRCRRRAGRASSLVSTATTTMFSPTRAPGAATRAFLADGNRARTFGKYLDDAGYRTMHAGKLCARLLEPFGGNRSCPVGTSGTPAMTSRCTRVTTTS